MNEQKLNLTYEYSKYVVAAMGHQMANWTNFPPDWVAARAMSYAEALADEFIKRTRE